MHNLPSVKVFCHLWGFEVYFSRLRCFTFVHFVFAVAEVSWIVATSLATSNYIYWKKACIKNQSCAIVQLQLLANPSVLCRFTVRCHYCICCWYAGGLGGACIRGRVKLGQTQPQRAGALPARHAGVCSDAAADPPLHYRCHWYWGEPGDALWVVV